MNGSDSDLDPSQLPFRHAVLSQNDTELMTEEWNLSRIAAKSKHHKNASALGHSFRPKKSVNHRNSRNVHTNNIVYKTNGNKELAGTTSVGGTMKGNHYMSPSVALTP
jgi:hypothetical protein